MLAPRAERVERPAAVALLFLEHLVDDRALRLGSEDRRHRRRRPQYRQLHVAGTTRQVIVQEIDERTDAWLGVRRGADVGWRLAYRERRNRGAVAKLRRRLPRIEVGVIPLPAAFERAVGLLQCPEL